MATGWLGGVLAHGAEPLYQNNFEKTEIDKVPEDFLIIDGGFAVKQVEGNKVLELPGAPLQEGSGLIFGPTEKEGLAVSARVLSTSKGRRMPAFSIGLNGVGGYKLQVSAAKKTIELYKNDEVKASAPFEWQSGTWTALKLQMRKGKDGVWKLEGKVWAQSGKEPTGWMISYDEKEEPTAGRPSLWGMPYAGTAIQFDDLLVEPAK